MRFYVLYFFILSEYHTRTVSPSQAHTPAVATGTYGVEKVPRQVPVIVQVWHIQVQHPLCLVLVRYSYSTGFRIPVLVQKENVLVLLSRVYRYRAGTVLVLEY